MIDFAALPPEVNSARMYSGSGAAPLMSAAAAWDSLATELTEAAADIGSTVMGLAGVWIGPSASAMTSAMTTYITWLTTTAEQALSTATQAQAAVTAYEAAFSATVPPISIIANRTQLAALVATNMLGQNTPAIMATEALYAEMWAQDAAAMYGYAASSQAATSALPQFTAAPQTTNPAGIAAQTAATAQATATASSNPLLQFLQTLIPGFTLGQPLQNLAALLTSPFGTAMIEQGFVGLDPVNGVAAFLALISLGQSQQALQIATGAVNVTPAMPIVNIPATPPVTTPGTPAAIRAGIADGERAGGLRVPPSWAQQRSPETQNTPAPARPIVATPDMAALGGLGGLGGLGALAAIPRGGTPTKQQRPEPQYGTTSTVVPKHPYGG